MTIIRVGSDAPRRRLIRDVVQAWYNVDPKMARHMGKMLKEAQQNEYKNGEWHTTGDGFCRVRLPSDLWHSLRKAFKAFLPLEPAFAQDSSDIEMLWREYPDLVPTGARKG